MPGRVGPHGEAEPRAVDPHAHKHGSGHIQSLTKASTAAAAHLAEHTPTSPADLVS